MDWVDLQNKCLETDIVAADSNSNAIPNTDPNTTSSSAGTNRVRVNSFVEGNMSILEDAIDANSVPPSIQPTADDA